MSSSYQSGQGPSSISKSAFCVPLSQVVESQRKDMNRSMQSLVDKDTQLYSQIFPMVSAAPSKLYREQNQFSAEFGSQKKGSLFSEQHKAQTSSTGYAEDSPVTNRNYNNFQMLNESNAPRNISEYQKLSKASFDMQLSQVIESQMSKNVREIRSAHNLLPIEVEHQYAELPPPARNATGSLLSLDESQHARSQWKDNAVQSVKSQFADDEPFKTTASIYQDIFSFPYFNILQSLVFEEVLYTDKSIVASAPTGSGKTVIFELALLRLLTKMESSEHRGKIVYMAPMKALCTERFQEWASKFSCHGLSCLEITGDSELVDFGELLKADLFCTTPEKWDSVSRRWRDNKSLFHQIQLFLIDEIHILNDPNRGATVEAVVSRMKTLQTANPSSDGNHIRFVAVSATMPNYKDIAEWLGTNCKPAAAFNLGEKFRPVKLDRIVLGYPFKEGTSDFRFDMNLSYRLKAIIETYSHGRPTLVFCSSRKSVVQTAEALAKGLRVRTSLTQYGTDLLQRAANSMHEHKLSELLQLGIGMHHAGMDTKDRHSIEEIFRTSQLPVLISTSTLAMGVNLPAHLVIIKSTHFYNMGLVQEYSDMQILQMIGRAGRPQFDTSATAVIMTKSGLKSKYESLVNGTQLIESSLHKNLIEHLNAEIVLQTISEMTLVVEWIRHTFLYVRVMKNPKFYGLDSNLSTSEVEKRLQDLCKKSLNQLSSLNLVSIDEETTSIFPTSTGRLMARYCIAYETMKQFHNIRDDQGSIDDMLIVMSQCTEFEDVQLRTSEKKLLNSFNKDKNRETIRFPMVGKIKTRQMKVNCLIQAQLSCLPVQDFSLSQDMAKIFRVGQRVTKCLMEYMYQRSTYSVLLHAILIYKAFKCKLWFDSRYVARQLDGIGSTMSLALANSGFTSFQKLDQASPREIELIVNRHPPFGNQIKETVSALPRYELTVEQMKGYRSNKAVLILSVDLLNRSILEERPSSRNTHQSLVIVGDAENNLIYKWRISDAAILREGVLSQTLEVKRSALGAKLSISLLSQDWVGLDIYMDYEPVYSEGWFQSVKMPLDQKAQTPASKLSRAVQLAKMKTGIKCGGRKTDWICGDDCKIGSSQQHDFFQTKSIGQCNHKCLDKTTCGHKCCKNISVKRTLPRGMETSCTKLTRRETSVLTENRDIMEMFNIVEQHSSVKNKPRISMIKDQGLKVVTPCRPKITVTPQPALSISNLDMQKKGASNSVVWDSISQPHSSEVDDFMDGHFNTCLSRVHKQVPRQLTPKERSSPNLDSRTNGWTDLDAFHKSRQDLFVNGRPKHLQEDLLYEDELAILSGSPQLDAGAVDEAVGDKAGDVVWSTTTSSDEELCQCVDASINPTIDEEEWLKTTYANTIQDGKKISFDHNENIWELYDDILNENLECVYNQTAFRRCGSLYPQNRSSPSVISVADSDSIISVNSSENQFGILNPRSRTPVLIRGNLSQSVTPTWNGNLESSLIVNSKENCESENMKAGNIDNNNSFVDKSSHDGDGTPSSQLCHRYGLVQAWKKDTSNCAKTSIARERVSRTASGISLYFMPKERISSQDSQMTTNLFEGIF